MMKNTEILTAATMLMVKEAKYLSELVWRNAKLAQTGYVKMAALPGFGFLEKAYHMNAANQLDTAVHDPRSFFSHAARNPVHGMNSLYDGSVLGEIGGVSAGNVLSGAGKALGSSRVGALGARTSAVGGALGKAALPLWVAGTVSPAFYNPQTGRSSLNTANNLYRHSQQMGLKNYGGGAGNTARAVGENGIKGFFNPLPAIYGAVDSGIGAMGAGVKSITSGREANRMALKTRQMQRQRSLPVDQSH